VGLIDRIQRILTGPVVLRSPDSSGALAAAVFGDVTGLDGPVSVGQAMAVPAISRAVDLYTAAITQMTLTASTESDETRWLNWSEGDITPQLRNALIFQDLFFHKFACLAVARNAAGHVENGLHIPRHLWTFDGEGNIMVNGQATPQDQVLLISSFKPLGLLTYAQDTIRQYISIARTVSDRLDNPVPMIGIEVDVTADPDEADTAVEEWGKARRAKGGATAIIPPGIKIVTPGADRDDSSMLLEARNASRLDAANFTNLPGSMLDGNSGASNDYSNTLQAANEFIRLSVSLYTKAIEARLSQDDVTAEGVTVTFNADSFDTLTTAKGNVGTAVGSATPTADTAAPAPESAGPSADDLVKLTNAVGTLIRSGFDPVESLTELGLDPIKHLGLLPVTVQKPVESDGTEDKGLVDDLTEGDTNS
jgi:hypothetical protein